MTLNVDSVFRYLMASITCDEMDLQVSATVSVATPLRACESLQNADVLQGRIVIVERGECMFVEKVSFLASRKLSYSSCEFEARTRFHTFILSFR